MRSKRKRIRRKSNQVDKHHEVRRCVCTVSGMPSILRIRSVSEPTPATQASLPGTQGRGTTKRLGVQTVTPLISTIRVINYISFIGLMLRCFGSHNFYRDVLPKPNRARRVCVHLVSSININVIPSFGRIVTVPETEKTRIVHSYTRRCPK